MKYVLTLIGGLLVGAVLMLFFMGAPRAKQMPGAPVQPPDAGGDAPGTAIVRIDENFFNTILGTIFKDAGAPAFPLKLASLKNGSQGDQMTMRYALFQSDCNDTVVLAQEGSGVKTVVRFADGKIVAPLAFSGSYSAPILGCVRFTGWAQANIKLFFDQSKQTVYGQVTVESVNLDDTSPIINNIITPLVQGAINQQVNPLEILRAPQLALNIPVQASHGTLKAQVKDVRSEVKDGVLLLHIA